MLDAGLRVGEAVGLQVLELWFAGSPAESITVPARCAKNKRERLVPASTRLREAISEYQMHIWEPDGSGPHTYAFTTGSERSPLTTRQVQRMIRIASYHAIGRRITPHTLRHTCATKWMRVVSMRVVQELLGHSSIQTTQIYTHPDHDDLRKAVTDAEAKP